MKKVSSFIIVDDDPFNNSLCKFVIKTVMSDADIIDFTYPEKALEYIETTYTNSANVYPTILLLDINMPLLSGWDFLERYEQFSDYLKQQFTIYILSSSVDWDDKEKAAANKLVKDYLIKPLTKESVEQIL